MKDIRNELRHSDHVYDDQDNGHYVDEETGTGNIFLNKKTRLTREEEKSEDRERKRNLKERQEGLQMICSSSLFVFTAKKKIMTC